MHPGRGVFVSSPDVALVVGVFQCIATALGPSSASLGFFC
jgi:hypothetical protein